MYYFLSISFSILFYLLLGRQRASAWLILSFQMVWYLIQSMLYDLYAWMFWYIIQILIAIAGWYHWQYGKKGGKGIVVQKTTFLSFFLSIATALTLVIFLWYGGYQPFVGPARNNPYLLETQIYRHYFIFFFYFLQVVGMLLATHKKQGAWMAFHLNFFFRFFFKLIDFGRLMMHYEMENIVKYTVIHSIYELPWVVMIANIILFYLSIQGYYLWKKGADKPIFSVKEQAYKHEEFYYL